MSVRVAVRRGGRIGEGGTPAALYDAPVSRFVADVLGESNFVDGVVVGASTAGRWLVRAAGGLEFRGVGAVSLQAGQPVTAAVRPEKLVPVEGSVGVAQTDAVHTCPGGVEERLYGVGP